MFKLNMHSVVDVITNSSTVIYTYQDNVKEAKELLQEVLNLVGNNEKVEDVFNIAVFLEEDYYSDFFEYAEDEEFEIPSDFPEHNWKKQNQYISNAIEKVLKGEIDKPQWMKDAEEREDWSGYTHPTSLYITAKDDKYKALAEKALSFLNAVDHEAFRDG